MQTMRYTGIKGKAWEAVRSYVKGRETDCYTCGKKNLSGADAQCGHYRTVAEVGSNNERCWMKEIIHLQCSYCNGARGGAQAKYRARLVKDYGEEWVDKYDKDVDSKKYAAIKDWKRIIDTFSEVL